MFGFTLETTCSIISEEDFLTNYNITFTKNFLLKCNEAKCFTKIVSIVPLFIVRRWLRT